MIIVPHGDQGLGIGERGLLFESVAGCQFAMRNLFCAFW